jgi:hypothetical protein
MYLHEVSEHWSAIQEYDNGYERFVVKYRNTLEISGRKKDMKENCGIEFQRFTRGNTPHSFQARFCSLSERKF